MKEYFDNLLTSVFSPPLRTVIFDARLVSSLKFTEAITNPYFEDGSNISTLWIHIFSIL